MFLFFTKSLFLIFWSLIGSLASGKVVDRLVIDVNGLNYTQRQMELYMVFKDVLQKSQSERIELLGPGNWSLSLTNYINEMIVSQEAQRLSSYSPTELEIESGLQQVSDRQKADFIFASFYNRMNASDSETRQIINQIFRFKSYIRGRSRGNIPSDYSSFAWFIKIRNRAVYRVFQGADVYMEINPDLLGKGLRLNLEDL